VQGLCLPPGTHAERLIAIGEHPGLGYATSDEQQDGEPSFALQVVQAVNVRVDGVPIAQAAGYDLTSQWGSIIPTTRETPTVDTGADFGWESRKLPMMPAPEPEPMPEPDSRADQAGLTGSASGEVLGQQGVSTEWVFQGQGTPQEVLCTAEGEETRKSVLSYQVIRRSSAYRSV
jgi:hypothetical protein